MKEHIRSFDEGGVNMPTLERKRYIIAIIIFFLAFLSYNWNYLFVAGDDFFEFHQEDSERLVLDGLLHARTSSVPIMGQYLRSGEDADYKKARALYEADNISGEFKSYRSQFGLQFVVFRFIADHFTRDYRVMQGVTAALMALTVALFYLGLVRLVSSEMSAVFVAPLVLGPWVVVFARNLYWVEFTWFLPSLVVLWLGDRAMTSRRWMTLLLASLFVTFSIKFLCGYEYVTTIVAGTLVFLLLHGLRQRQSVGRLLLQATAVGSVSLAAFATCILLHAAMLGPNLKSGLAEIGDVAAKRSTKDFCDLDCVKAICDGRQECIDKFEQSLEANAVKVAARYLIVPHALPWLDRLELRQEDKDALAALVRSRDFGALPTGDQVVLALKVLFVGIGVLSFFALGLALLWRLLFRRRELTVVAAAAFLGSVSWFFAAKGHSAIHTHMNYVLWYLFYIPFALMHIAFPRSGLSPAESEGRDGLSETPLT